MTQNQLSFAKVREDIRHNTEQERIGKEQNKINKQHYNKQDTYTKEHYERGDTASLISANASAMNAQTNKGKYQMDYDIEYGWTGDTAYPKGMPLSAQQKNMDLYIAYQKFPIEFQTMLENYNLTKAKTENVEAGTSELKTKSAKEASDIIKNIANFVMGKHSLVDIADSVIE